MKARRLIRIALGIVLVLGVAVYAYIRSITPQLDLGVGYGARVACGCRYIEGRPLAQCRTDFEKGMEPIRLADDPATKTVTAYVPLIARRSVRFDPVLGCRAEPFRGTPLRVR